MRKLAKLALFFSITFIITLAVVICIRFLSLRVDWAKSLPPKPETTLTLMITAAHWALSLSLFSSIIVTLNYARRRSCFAPISILCVFLLSFFFCFGISFALEQWKAVPPDQSAGITLGDKGLILTNALNKNETAVVLLNGMAEPLGPRIIAIPGQPLIYQSSAAVNFDLPPVPFGNETPWFLQDISIDIRLNAEMFQRKFSEGFISYLFYAGALIFMLCSLSYAIKFSVWPLANLFLAVLAFRGILALNTFINTPAMQEVISSLINNMIPVVFVLPLSFIAFGILVNIYSLLVFAAKRRSDDDD